MPADPAAGVVSAAASQANHEVERQYLMLKSRTQEHDHDTLPCEPAKNERR
jgi:hypothetical protein